MQQIAAVRGAVNGLMAEVLEDHIRVHVFSADPDAAAERAAGAEELIDLVRAYLK
jgi:DNA-binding FrmR family transcriptional regulator